MTKGADSVRSHSGDSPDCGGPSEAGVAVRQQREELLHRIGGRRAEPCLEALAYPPEFGPRRVEELVAEPVHPGGQPARETVETVRGVPQLVRIRDQEIEAGVAGRVRLEAGEPGLGRLLLREESRDQPAAGGRRAPRPLQLAEVRDGTEAAAAVQPEPGAAGAQVLTGQDVARRRLCHLAASGAVGRS